MIIDEIISTSSSSSTISLPIRKTDDHFQRSIYNVIIQNNVEKLAEILKNKNNINFDINQPLIKTKVKKFKSDGEKEIDEEENDGESDGDHKNALMVACSLDCVNIVRFLLSRTNINIDLQDKNGETALYQASALGNIKMVKLLLSYNANLDIYNKDKTTPLMISSFNGHNGVVKVLLSKCKNVNFQDNLCKTALSFAALEAHPQVVELLLKKGADVNLPDKLGWTPLMLAAFVGRANICRQLLVAKADKNLRTNDNKTASILAREGGFHHVAEMINQFNLNLDPSNILLNPPNILLNSSNMSACSYDEEYGRKSESRYSRHSHYSENMDSRRISTGSRLRMEMLPREENTWWVYLSWIVTIFFLDRFLIKYGKMNDERIRQAWREKVTLCFIILLTSVFIALLTFGFTGLACSSSSQTPLSVINELWSENSRGNDKVMIVRGKIYNVGEYFKYGGHRPINPFNDKMLEPIINQYYGKDVGELFPINNVAIGCNRSPDINGFCNTAEADARYHCHTSMNSHKTLESLSINRYVSISWDEIANSPSRKLFAYKGMVYDLTEYLSASNTDKWLGLDNNTTTWLENLIGKDATSDILNAKNNDIKEAIKCLENFQVGTVEGLQYGCATTKVIIIVITGVATIFSIMKLLSALIFDNYLSKKLAKTDNIFIEDFTKDVILMVPCYSEGYESMKNSFDSLAATYYPDQNKIFFIVADGNITGSGNDKSTPDILLDFIVPFDKSFYNVKAKSYLSLGEGTKRHNMAKVYSGYYRYQDKDIPTILIIKVGNPEESKYPRAGNRGKRDSQLILMQLLQHAFNNDAMTPLEFDIFEKFRKLTRKTIDQYEFVVMVDADTVVKEDSINNMISCMNNDSSIIGLCGETKILNTTYNWVTMIQVFEYYLSHHLGKPFESVYACVTCLPGCFCMYRIFSYNHDGFRVPILIDENVMSNYSTTEIDTLHQKNLLLLGEDRYLTTLILRAFPKRRTMYCPSAVCETIVPTEFKVLLSQRRRWINGTIHNMFELIASSELPGRFCFSMQFAVFLDLFGTFTSPFALSYILSSIIAMLFGHSSQSALFIAMAFMVQVFLAIFTSYSPIVVIWFFVFLISLPIWYIILPLYSFWNFDDFSWGATRKLNDDGKSSYSDTIFDRFDPKSVPRKKWNQWIKSTSRHLTVNPFY